MGDMLSHNSLAGGLGELVLNISTGDLGDGVAVLNLNGDSLDLGVVHTVLSGDLTASVLHGGLDGVGNSMSSNGSNGGMGNNGSMGSIGVGSKVLSISISLGLSLTLGNGVVSTNNGCNRGVTDGVNNLLADLLVLDLLSIHSLLGAHILSGGSADLGGQDYFLSCARGGGSSMVGKRGSKVLRVGLSISLRGRGGSSQGQEARYSKYLHLE